MNAPAATPASFTYDRRTIALHWLCAALIAGLWIVGQTIDVFPKGMPRVSARSCHILAGALLVPLMLARIHWRFTGGRRLPAELVDGGQKAAAAMHGIIYLLVLATLALGVVNAWVRGDSIFGLFAIPSFAPGDEKLADAIGDWHALAANTVAVAVVLHAVTGLVHRLVLRDGVLQRMSPRA